MEENQRTIATEKGTTDFSRSTYIIALSIAGVVSIVLAIFLANKFPNKNIFQLCMSSFFLCLSFLYLIGVKASGIKGRPLFQLLIFLSILGTGVAAFFLGMAVVSLLFVISLILGYFEKRRNSKTST
jgi:hypothetical protein